jgi:hypothetical protein
MLHLLPLLGLTSCPWNLTSTLTQNQLQEKIQELVKVLKINVISTSAYRRVFTCADDHRPSAAGIGWTLGAGMLTVVFGVVFIADLQKLFAPMRNALKLLFNIR